MDWKHNGVQSLLVKPIGTQDLLRQIEALLVQHQDGKQSELSPAEKKQKIG
jgi:hypothetical protein